MRLTVVLIGSAALTLAACTPAKEQALNECKQQMSERELPGQVDTDLLCDCVTKTIPDGASVEEAKKAMTDQMQTCTMEQIENIMSGMTAPTSEPGAEPAPAGE